MIFDSIAVPRTGGGRREHAVFRALTAVLLARNILTMTRWTLRSAACCGLLVGFWSCAPLTAGAYPTSPESRQGQVEPEDLEGLRLAAEQGDAQSQFGLGTLYYEGRQLPQNDAAAARWIGLAADQGHAVAQFSLGLLYYEGRGVQVDRAEAVRWYRISAEQGYAEAQYSLALAFEDGAGVQRDAASAVEWFRLAADQGHPVAQYFLGLKYDQGDGVMKDPVAAHMWLFLAAEQTVGDEWETFVGALDEVAARMTPTQVAEAERLAREFTPTLQP